MKPLTSIELANILRIQRLTKGNARAEVRLYRKRYLQGDAPDHRIFTITCIHFHVNMDCCVVIGVEMVGLEWLEFQAWYNIALDTVRRNPAFEPLL
ncbi:hypothetical protein TNCV_3632071 [Trichonephila clavipes]|nr:hypothetical protein TNCV_3632071 [Trichonephila clavipes]